MKQLLKLLKGWVRPLNMGVRKLRARRQRPEHPATPQKAKNVYPLW